VGLKSELLVGLYCSDSEMTKELIKA
jgi:hypothetical protein